MQDDNFYTPLHMLPSALAGDHPPTKDGVSMLTKDLLMDPAGTAPWSGRMGLLQLRGQQNRGAHLKSPKSSMWISPKPSKPWVFFPRALSALLRALHIA